MWLVFFFVTAGALLHLNLSNLGLNDKDHAANTHYQLLSFNIHLKTNMQRHVSTHALSPSPKLLLLLSSILVNSFL